jgi:hypothetical protein
MAESNARKWTYEEEERLSQQRLKKSDETLLWDLRSVMQARGLDAEEIKLYLAQQADRSFLYQEA